MKVRKAVIPAAGYGTRFLPASKSQPKEMLPIVDTPTIQYVVEEVVASGIRDILMVIGKSKRAIEEHFDRSFELEAELKAKEKTEELEQILEISSLANIHFVWQKELRGLGDAVLCARQHVGDEPFALLLGDTLIESANGPATRQLIDVFDRFGEMVVMLEEVELSKVGRYGIMGGKPIENNLYLVEQFIERPDPAEAPSTLAIAGRYVFTAEIFETLQDATPGKNGEIQLTDSTQQLLSKRAAYGVKLDGRRHDIGNKLDFLKTNVHFALRRDDVGPAFRDFLREVVSE